MFCAYIVSTFLTVQMNMTFLTEVSANCMDISLIENLIEIPNNFWTIRRITESNFSHMLSCTFAITPSNRTVSPLVENGSCLINVQGMVKNKTGLL